MADINDIRQDLTDIENIINGPDGLVKTKEAIKTAIESKLNTTIPDENPLRVYDDYIYQIPSSMEQSRTLVLGDTVLGIPYQINFEYSGIPRESVYFNPNGEISFDNNSIVYEGLGDNFGSLGGVKINRPSALIAANILQGVKIFGVEGNAIADGVDTTMVTARPQDISGGDKVSTEAKIFVDDTGAEREGTLTDYRFETESELFVPIIPTSYNLDSETGNIVSFNSNIDENNFEIDNSHDVIINENTNLIFSVSSLNDLINEQLEPEKKILPENIKYGSSILGVDGTFSQILQGETAAEKNYLLKGAVAYVNGEKITGRVPRKFYTDDITIEDGKLLIGAGIYWTSGCHDGSVFTRTLPEANFTLSYDEVITTLPDDPKYIEGGRHKEITVSPTLDITTEGYLLPNTYDEPGTLIDGTDIINQDFFTDEYLDEHGYSRISPFRMLSGTLGVNQYGDILEGNIPIFTVADGNIEWSYNKYTDGGLITSPGSGSQWGYYTAISNVLITEDRLKRAYNNYYSSDPTKQLAAENIRLGVTLFGVEGNYSGAVNPIDRDISSAEINFSNGNTITFTPDLGDLYESVTLNISPDLTPGNIVKDKTIYGITGTFTDASTISRPGNKLATSDQILSGYTAWANGNQYSGSIPNKGYFSLDIQDPWSGTTLPAGYYSGGYIKVNPNQLDNLIPSNIRSGISIFGVTGTYSGSIPINFKYVNLDKSSPDIDPYNAVLTISSEGYFIVDTPTSNNRFFAVESDGFHLPKANPTETVYKEYSSNSSVTVGIIKPTKGMTTLASNYYCIILVNGEAKYSSYIDSISDNSFPPPTMPADASVMTNSINYVINSSSPVDVEFSLFSGGDYIYDKNHHQLVPGDCTLGWLIDVTINENTLYDTSAADPNNGGASPEDVASGKIFFNNSGSHNGTLVDGRGTVILTNSNLSCYNSENNVFYFHPVNNSIIDSGEDSVLLQSGLAVFAGYIGENTPDLSAENIKSGVTILGVTGTLSTPQITQDPVTGIVTII